MSPVYLTAYLCNITTPSEYDTRTSTTDTHQNSYQKLEANTIKKAMSFDKFETLIFSFINPEIRSVFSIHNSNSIKFLARLLRF